MVVTQLSGKPSEDTLIDALRGCQNVQDLKELEQRLAQLEDAPPLFDYVRRAMPFAEPGTLQDDEVYALVAYLLFVNGIVAEDTILDAEKLSRVSMPNRDRFFSEFQLPN